jgi:hypothetical protein
MWTLPVRYRLPQAAARNPIPSVARETISWTGLLDRRNSMQKKLKIIVDVRARRKYSHTQIKGMNPETKHENKKS